MSHQTREGDVISLTSSPSSHAPTPPPSSPCSPLHELSRTALQAVDRPQLVIVLEGSRRVGAGLSAHVEYQLTYRTTLPGLPALTGKVGRRYREFKWLHGALVEEWCGPERKQWRPPSCRLFNSCAPWARLHLRFQCRRLTSLFLCRHGTGVIVPPLPVARTTYFRRFEESYVEARRIALELFLCRCATHTLVRESRSLAAFLSVTEPGRFLVVQQEWREAETARRSRKSDSRRVFSIAWLHHPRIFQPRVSSAPTNLAQDGKWGNLVLHLDHFEQQMLTLCRCSQKVAAQTASRGRTMEDFGRVAATLGMTVGSFDSKA